MCTLTYFPQEDGYSIYFNRDEQKVRDKSSGVMRHDHNGVASLYPIDIPSHGTWIATNEWGLTFALLNGYVDAYTPSDVFKESRGGLIPSLLHSRTTNDVRKNVMLWDVKRYMSFHLVLFRTGELPVRWSWDGHALKEMTLAEFAFPLSSSSYHQEQAYVERKSTYDVVVGKDADHEKLLAFHQSHLPKKGPFSVCVHRDDVETVSLTRVTVTPSDVNMWIVLGAPCTNNFSDRVYLPLNKSYRKSR